MYVCVCACECMDRLSEITKLYRINCNFHYILISNNDNRYSYAQNIGDSI